MKLGKRIKWSDDMYVIYNIKDGEILKSFGEAIIFEEKHKAECYLKSIKYDYNSEYYRFDIKKIKEIITN